MRPRCGPRPHGSRRGCAALHHEELSLLASSAAGRLLVPLQNLARKILLACETPAANPDFRDLAVAAAQPLDRFAWAGKSAGTNHLALVSAAQSDFTHLRERRIEYRRRRQHLVADRHEVDRAPQRPPPASPVFGFGARRAAGVKCLQDVTDAVEPN